MHKPICKPSVLTGLAIYASSLFATSSIVLAATPAWSTPPLLLNSATNLDTISNHRTVMNAKGQIVTAWIQGTQLQAKTRNANKWGAPVALSAAGDTAQLLDIAESPLNEAVVLFNSSSAASGIAVTETSFFNAGKWSAPQAIPATTGARIINAKLAYDGKTALPATPTATLVWVEQVTNPVVSCSIMTATGNAVTGWSTPTLIGNGCYSFIQLAVNKRGEAALALGAPGKRGSPAIVASRNISGIWSSMTDLGSLTYGTPPVVAIPDNGAAIALFSDAMLGVQWSRRSPTDGSWSAKSTIDGAVPAVPVAIAMAANGAAVAVYNSYYTNVGPAPLQVATLKAGSNAWKVDPVNPYITDPAGTIDNFQVSATPAGSFIVGWVEAFPTTPVGATSSMGVSVLPFGSTAWSMTTLDGDLSLSYANASSFSVAVSSAASRGAIAVWNNFDAGGLNLNQLKASTLVIK